MLRRTLVVSSLTLAALGVAAPALACGGLVGPKGAVNLLRTSTLAAYHGGVEHYVTSFEFAGAEGNFGSIVPLPGEPSKVERGGRWTLQRLVQEVTPVPEFRVLADSPVALTASATARVILQTKIDALDITVLEGGGSAVARWAEQNGFTLSPDAPEVLDFYGRRSPYFMAARFDVEAAVERGQRGGDGTPIHLTIPTDDPWVPLRILGLGKGSSELIQADVFLLTDREPVMLPGPSGARGSAVTSSGMTLDRSERASASLTADLRSDKGMGWMPEEPMWLSYVRLDTTAGDLRFDLAIDASGQGRPSWVDAGLAGLREAAREAADDSAPAWAIGMVLAVAFLVAVRALFRRPGMPAA